MVIPVEEQIKRIEEKKKRDSLIYSVLDGSAFAVMAGFGENYLNPFAIELGATNQQLGFFASVPQLIGSASQLFSAYLVDFWKKRRLLICIAVLFQALMWLPLFAIPFLPQSWWLSTSMIFVVLYFVFGHFASPPWNSLMGDLVSPDKRGFFFGKRNKITGCITFLSIFVGGLILYYFQKTSVQEIDVLTGFSIIFAIAMFARLISLYFLTKMVELPYNPVIHKQKSFFEFIKSLNKTNEGLFVFYLCLINFAVQISGPFFSAYMLRDLHFSYIQFSLVNIGSTIATFLAMTYWGNTADYYGNKKIITITGWLIPIVPLLWLFSTDVPYLIIINIVSGFAWAGFNLSSVNFLFDTTKPLERARHFAYYNVLNGISIFLGASLGGFLATHITFSWIYVSNLPMLFLISGLLRGLISFIFLPRINEVRPVHPAGTKELFWNLVAVRPFYGMRYELVTSMSKLGKVAGKVSDIVEESMDEAGIHLKNLKPKDFRPWSKNSKNK